MQNRGKSDKHTWKYWHEIPFLLLHAVLESKLETWVPGAHQGFHASSEHHLWHAGLPHDLMTHHASWWLLVTPCFILLRCQSCDVAACGGMWCKFCEDQFDTKVYGIVIQSLVEEPGPLPTLFMRTVIQVVCSPSHWNGESEELRIWETPKGIYSECFKDSHVGCEGYYLERLKKAVEVKELPRLSDFIVMEILPRLVRQEVWGDENMWCFA